VSVSIVYLRGDLMIDYRLYLCKPNKEIICEIDYNDVTFTENFRSFDELTFTVPYYENGWQMNKDERFDLTKILYYVFMEKYDDDELVKSEYFVIDNPEANYDDGITVKNIHCFASHYMIFNKRILRAYKQVNLLYDSTKPNDPSAGLLNYIRANLYNTWDIVMDAKYEGIYHYFNYSSSTYVEVFKDIEEQYNCFVLIDNVNNIIYIKDPETYGVDSGLVLSNENYIKSISNVSKGNEIITRLRVYGKNNISITKYNPTGQMYIDNFDWLINNGYFSESLDTAYNNYKTLLNSKIGIFEGYINQLEELESQLLVKQNELAVLEMNKKTLEDTLNTYKMTEYRNSSGYNSAYSNYQSVLGAINSKNNEINSIKNQINTVNANIAVLRDEISYDNNFTPEQLEELNLFIYESDLNLNSCDDEKLLYEYAKQYIVKRSNPVIDIDVSSIDIFSAEEVKLDSRKIVLGNFAYIDCPEVGFNYYQTRIVKIEHNKSSNSLSITLSNADKINREISYLNEIFKLSNQASNTLIVNQDDYSKYIEDSDSILYDGDVITNPIQAGNNRIDYNGVIGYNPNGQLQIIGDRIVFSTDNFANFYTILSASRGLYLETPNGRTSIEINPNVGFRIRSNSVDTVYIDSDGRVVFAGDIQTSSDVRVGNNIYVGSPTTYIEKGIYFYTSGSSLDKSGLFFTEVEPNFYALTLADYTRPLYITSGDSVNIGGYGETTFYIDDDYFALIGATEVSSRVTHLGSGDLEISHQGSGTLWLLHNGSGVLKIESYNNMSINSIEGLIYAQGTWKFTNHPYVGALTENNMLTTVEDVITLIQAYLGGLG